MSSSSGEDDDEMTLHVGTGDGELLPPTVEKLSRQCWRCAATLKVPAGEPCLYATHAHLLLDVPVCSFCAEEVAAIEMMVDEEEKSSYCAGCAVSEDDGGTFFLCDNNTCEAAACKRAFCFTCVAKAHGGGLAGVRAARKIEADGADEPWHCPACSPPVELVELRERVAQDLDDQRDRVQRDADFLLGQLSRAEEEKQRCDEELDTDPEHKATELRNDLLEQDPSLGGDELDELVRESIEIWQEDWKLHESRVSDFIYGLLDELDAEHSFTPAMCFTAIGVVMPGQTTGGQAPDWVGAADEEVDERMRERENGPAINPLPDEAYEEDDFLDVEDLGPDDLADDYATLSLRTGFKSKNARPTERKVQAALLNEERLQVHVRAVVNDSQDRDEILKDKRLAVSGAIRNDWLRPRSTPRSRDPALLARSDIPVTAYSPGIASTDRSPGTAKRSMTGWPDSLNLKKPRVTTALPFSSAASENEETLHVNDQVAHTVAVSAPVADGIKTGSPLVLCDASQNVDGVSPIRTVAVASQLAKQLKPHQAEGVEFMWRNSFSDFAHTYEGSAKDSGGCILAHSMGLVSHYCYNWDLPQNCVLSRRLSALQCRASLSPPLLCYTQS